MGSGGCRIMGNEGSASGGGEEEVCTAYKTRNNY